MAYPTRSHAFTPAAPPPQQVSALPNVQDLWEMDDLDDPETKPPFPYSAQANKRVSVWRGSSPFTMTSTGWISFLADIRRRYHPDSGMYSPDRAT